MLKLEVVGHLGADAEIKVKNGREFTTFRVASSEKWTNKETGEITESTTWVSCIMSGGGNLARYLKSGQKVFVRGSMSLSVYSSPKTRQMEAGVNLNVYEVELCGDSINETKILSFCQNLSPDQRQELVNKIPL